MKISNKYPNGVTCVWTYCMGDEEEEIEMWEEQLVSSTSSASSSSCLQEAQDDAPARGPVSIYSEQEKVQYVRASVSSALERARQRHSARVEQRRRSASSLSPRANIQNSLSPIQRRVKVRQSMVAALPLHNMDA